MPGFSVGWLIRDWNLKCWSIPFHSKMSLYKTTLIGLEKKLIPRSRFIWEGSPWEGCSQLNFVNFLNQRRLCSFPLPKLSQNFPGIFGSTAGILSGASFLPSSSNGVRFVFDLCWEKSMENPSSFLQI